MTRPAHTALPWLVAEDDNRVVLDGERYYVASMDPDKAALIVRAVNERADLIRALGYALGTLTGGMDGEWPDHDTLPLIREVYARAKEPRP